MQNQAYRLDPLYINERRVLAITGAEPPHVPSISNESEKAHQIRSTILHARILQNWLQRTSDVLPFEVEWSSGQLAPGRLVTALRHFTFRNARGRRKNVTPCGSAKYAGLASDGGAVELKLALHPDHVVVGSPGDLLERVVADLFVVAGVLKVDESIVDAVPIVIGHRIRQGPMGQIISVRSNEVFPEQIDNFAKIRDVRSITAKQRDALRTIPEATIKELLARVLNEPLVPKDWGGERSDLYVGNVSVDGRPVSAAFLLKGPAGGSKFRPMIIRDLGKRSDQIARLATEPADLLVVQHCSSITPEVRDLLRAYASQVGREKRYCLIDGDATARLLQAYGSLL